MQLLPFVAEALRIFTSPPARHRLAARTVLWAVAGLLTLAAAVFALIGVHAVLADLLSPVAASFVLALGLFVSAALLGFGAWLAGPAKPQAARSDNDLAIIIAGFLDGLANPAEESRRRSGRPSGAQD